MQLDLVTTSGGLEDLREDWEALERRDPHATYYVTHRFVRAWWAAYDGAPGHALRLACWREGGRLVGVAPMSVRPGTRHGQPTRILRWASHGDFMTVLADPDRADAVHKAFLDFMDQPEEWHSINLPGIPGDHPLAHHLLKSPYNRNLTFLVENPYLDLSGFGSFEAFAAHHLPSHTRKYRNKLLREKEVTFHVYRGDEEGILDRIAEVHRAEKRFLVESKDRTERHSLYEDERRLAHVRNVFTGTDDAVTFAYVDPAGAVVGYRTAYAHGRTLLSWNSAYLPEYDRYRIGKVIQYDILEHLLAERAYDVFDFGAGRYAWKFEWTPTYRATYRFQRRLAEPEQSAATQQVPEQATAPARQAAPQPAPSSVRTLVARQAAPPPWREPSALRRVADAAHLPGLKRRAGRAVQTARRPLAPPVIWYVPHPDDESIFMGGSIARVRDRRNILVVLTRGGGSTAVRKISERLGRELTVEEFMAGRQAELAAAVAALGVRPRDVIQHDLPDGSITEADVFQIVTAMAARHPGAAHRTLSYVDPHPDHRTTGRALRRAYDEGVVADVLFYMPVPIMTARKFQRAPLGVPDVAAKRAALEEYRRWAPEEGRFAIGATSVTTILDKQIANPVERVHGPEHPLPKRQRA